MMDGGGGRVELGGSRRGGTSLEDPFMIRN